MNTYDSFDPYGTYDINVTNPYEMLMRMKSWNMELRSTVSGVRNDLTSAESQIIQNAEQITLRVTYEDYTGEVITSLIVQDAFSISFLAQNLNLVGLVNFEDLAGQNGRTVIHGGNILTKTILADSIMVTELSALSADLGVINAGVINGIQINSANINVNEDVQVGQWLTVGKGFDTVEKGIRFKGSTVYMSTYGDSLTVAGSFVTLAGNINLVGTVYVNGQLLEVG